MIEFPSSWRVRPFLHLRVVVLLVRRSRSLGVVAIGHFPFWVYSDGQHVGRGSVITVAGRRKHLGSSISSIRYFRAARLSQPFDVQVFVPDDLHREFRLQGLEQGAKYVVYMEPARKDGVPPKAEIRRVHRSGFFSFALESLNAGEV